MHELCVSKRSFRICLSTLFEILWQAISRSSAIFLIVFLGTAVDFVRAADKRLHRQSYVMVTFVKSVKSFNVLALKII